MEKKTKQTKPHNFEKELSECKAGWQRTQADFENFRRRAEEQKKELADYANRELLLELLPILDNFQLAAKHIPSEIENNQWAVGILYIEKQIQDVLSQIGVEKIRTEGEFDPNMHEAIETEESEIEKNHITQTIQSGYIYKGKLLRPARVKVSSGKEE